MPSDLVMNCKPSIKMLYKNKGTKADALFMQILNPWFFLQEESLYERLTLLPRLLPPQIDFKLIPYKGKQDLEKTICHK
jgi:hypothetical protein